MTGTNGKTTTTFLLDAMFRAAGFVTGLIGTVEYRVAEHTFAANYTTPPSDRYQALLAVMERAGVSHVSSEVSSHALTERRVDGTEYDAAIFTNLTRDHIDFHGTMAAYGAAKRRLFEDLLANSAKKRPKAIVNVDDDFGAALVGSLPPRIGTVSFSVKPSSKADVAPVRVTETRSGFRGILRTPSGTIELASPLIGLHNLSNLLGAVAAAQALDVANDAIALALQGSRGAPGRLERVPNDLAVEAFVDYAHSPDALTRVLETCRRLAAPKSGRVIVIFGCGGDRDRGKRPMMGAAAAKLADHVLLTSDNPRNEAPEEISTDILKGIPDEAKKERVVVVLDRGAAIRRAVQDAQSNDIILVAGKGHEAYQATRAGLHFFDDRQELALAFAARRPTADKTADNDRARAVRFPPLPKFRATLREVQSRLGARSFGGSLVDAPITGIAFHPDDVNRGSLFVLHPSCRLERQLDLVARVAQRGAVGILASSAYASFLGYLRVPIPLPLLIVDDLPAALRDLGSSPRSHRSATGRFWMPEPVPAEPSVSQIARASTEPAMLTPPLRDRKSRLEWGPNRYSEHPVMRVELERSAASWSTEDGTRIHAWLQAIAPSARVDSAGGFVALVAAALVAVALDAPSRAIVRPDEPDVAVFEVPLHTVGRCAFLHAAALLSELLSGREPRWTDALAHARAWPTDVDRRVVEMLQWARANSVPVRPKEPPVSWTLGQGARTTTFSAADSEKDEAMTRLVDMFARKQVGVVPVIVVAGGHGKTACCRVLLAALARFKADAAYVGEVCGPDGAGGTPGPDPRAKMLIVEAPAFGASSAPVPYHPHATIILNTAAPPEDGGVSKGRARYRHYLELAKRTRPGGLLVLNVNDAMCRRLAGASELEHLRLVPFSPSGKKALGLVPLVARADGQVLARVHGSLRPQFSIAPFGTVGGLPGVFVAPLLAAFATLLAIGDKPLATVVRVLSRFQANVANAPGCFNLHRIRSARVLVHRANGIAEHRRLWGEIPDLCRRLGIDRVHAVVGASRRAGSEAATFALYQSECASVVGAMSAAVGVEAVAPVPYVLAKLSTLGPRELLVVAMNDVTELNDVLQRVPHR